MFLFPYPCQPQIPVFYFIFQTPFPLQCEMGALLKVLLEITIENSFFLKSKLFIWFSLPQRVATSQRLQLSVPDYFFISSDLMHPVYKEKSCDWQNSCYKSSLDFVVVCAILLELRDEQAVNSLKMYTLRQEIKLVETQQSIQLPKSSQLDSIIQHRCDPKEISSTTGVRLSCQHSVRRCVISSCNSPPRQNQPAKLPACASGAIHFSITLEILLCSICLGKIRQVFRSML